MHKGVNFTAHEAAWYGRHVIRSIYILALKTRVSKGVQREGKGESAAS